VCAAVAGRAYSASAELTDGQQKQQSCLEATVGRFGYSQDSIFAVTANKERLFFIQNLWPQQ
jgi:hypothetical protein